MLPLGKYNDDEMASHGQDVWAFVCLDCLFDNSINTVQLYDQILSSVSWIIIFHTEKIEEVADPKLEFDARHKGKLLREKHQ
jgi:hypothetical protein